MLDAGEKQLKLIAQNTHGRKELMKAKQVHADTRVMGFILRRRSPRVFTRVPTLFEMSFLRTFKYYCILL